MNPNIWGPAGWRFLHSITFNYPHRPNLKDMNNAIIFFTSVGEMLPCVKCLEHYRENLKKYPISEAVYSRDALVNWLITIHNEVNRQLGKPIIDNQDVIHRYQKFQGYLNDKITTRPMFSTGVSIAIIIGFIIILVYYFKTN